tara:strand:- start:1034 stop:1483 length:450 start_codon:yes stop_codon:yes gene_type:complete
MAQQNHTVAQQPAINVISTPVYNYQADGASAIWRARAINSSVGMELFKSVRETKWFTLIDYETTAKMRRVRLSYKSARNITVKVYKDFETEPCHHLNFKMSGTRTIERIKASARCKVLKLRIETPSWATGGIEIYGCEIELDTGNEQRR